MNRAMRMTSVLEPEADSVNCQKGRPIRSARILLTAIASSVGDRRTSLSTHAGLTAMSLKMVSAGGM